MRLWRCLAILVCFALAVERAAGERAGQHGRNLRQGRRTAAGAVLPGRHGDVERSGADSAAGRA